jgi:hypothetical protein
VDHRGVQRDRVRQVGPVGHHLDEERLPGGHVERVDQPLHEREHRDHRGREDAGQVQPAEGGRLEHGQDLGDHEQPAAVDPVGDHAGQRGDQQQRQLPGEADVPEPPRVLGQVVDEPRDGDGGQKRAAQRDELAGEEQPVVPVGERPEHAGRPGRHGGGSAATGGGVVVGGVARGRLHRPGMIRDRGEGRDRRKVRPNAE